MTRSKSKGDDCSGKENSAFEMLSERMEQMADKFAGDLAKFKKELLLPGNRKLVDIEKSDANKLAERFFQFEKSVLGSLDEIRTEISQLKFTATKQVMDVNLNVILVHGVEENQTDLYESVCNLITTKININIRKTDLNYCYRLGQKKPDQNRPRPIVVSFCQRWKRNEVFANKKRLKGSSVLFTELLTSDNLKLFKETRHYFHNSCWSMGGKVFVLCKGAKVLVKSIDELKKISTNSGTGTSEKDSDSN